jgi:hypothetical protein
VHKGCCVLSVALLAGCGNTTNTDCVWPPDPPVALNLSDPADARHLIQDIELAEELSIRFADERWAPGRARRDGRDAQCFAPLVQQIIERHSVSAANVVAAREQLGDRGLNLAVNVPVTAFFALLSVFLLRLVDRRFTLLDEPMAVVVAVAICGLLVGGLTAGFGRLWEGALEVICLGNDHLSYRGARLQWNRLWLRFGMLAAAGFVVTALAHYGATTIRRRRSASAPLAP